jgi:hypothetical protein
VILSNNDPDTAHVLADLRQRFIPNKIVACRRPSKESNESSPLAPLFAGKSPQQPPPTVFICENFTCQAPVNGKQSAIEVWQRL